MKLLINIGALVGARAEAPARLAGAEMNDIPVLENAWLKIDGERIAGFPSLDVPVWLSTITLVKGNFLTTKASGGVGIDPGFDGEFNIKWN